MDELKKSKCRRYKITGSWNLKNWYTMTLWESETDINEFYRSGTHLEAMKQSRNFSSNIKSKRTNGADLISWGEAKKLLANN